MGSDAPIHDREDLFVDHGLRRTRQRALVYEELLANRAHPTAEDLHARIRAKVGRFSLATVYNALDALCKARLAQRLTTEGGTQRFDACMQPHAHVRLEKDRGKTEEILDVPDALSRRLLSAIPSEVLREIEEELGVTVRGVRVEVVAEFPATKPSRIER